MSSVSTRLVRLLNMVPYFQANPRITRAEAAAELGVTEKQLHPDLDQLWMCGLPGYGPGDLIDFEFSGDTIEVTFSAGMDHPLRLTSPEATGILVALRALLEVPGIVDPEAARSAIAKIESAAGDGDRRPRGCRRRDRRAGARSRAGPPQRCAPRCATVARCRSTTTRRRTTRCPAASSTRSAWCWSPTTPTSRRGAGPPRASGCSGSTASSTRGCSTSRPRRPSLPCRPAPTRRCSTPIPSLPAATLLIDRSAAWMFDYYPLRVVRELPDGACEAAMTYASDGWMARFVLGFGSARARAGTAVAGRSGAGVRGRRARGATTAVERRRGRVDSAHNILEVSKLGGLQPWHWLIVIAVVRAAVRCQEAPRRGAFAGQVDAHLQVRDQGDAVRRQATTTPPSRPRRRRRSPRSESSRLRHRAEQSTEQRPA